MAQLNPTEKVINIITSSGGKKLANIINAIKQDGVLMNEASKQEDTEGLTILAAAIKTGNYDLVKALYDNFKDTINLSQEFTFQNVGYTPATFARKIGSEKYQDYKIKEFIEDTITGTSENVGSQNIQSTATATATATATFGGELPLHFKRKFTKLNRHVQQSKKSHKSHKTLKLLKRSRRI